MNIPTFWDRIIDFIYFISKDNTNIYLCSFFFDQCSRTDRLVDTLPDCVFFALFNLISIYWAVLIYSLFTKRVDLILTYTYRIFGISIILELALWLSLGLGFPDPLMIPKKPQSAQKIRFVLTSSSEILIASLFLLFFIYCTVMFKRSKNTINKTRYWMISSFLLFVVFFFTFRGLFFLLVPYLTLHYPSLIEAAKVFGMLVLEYSPTLVVLAYFRPKKREDSSLGNTHDDVQSSPLLVGIPINSACEQGR
eukprot:TRINITY_DN3592_c0_g1_i2.p1 TRINITY_DN3592_c0_g1~~TRINITY_DN3592_c0_g1_i2.p1  ORF type:complete len:251 (+),score=23.54 TRINITY_DN3592_c0_g1_i2:388-1140(+)